jgi:hypothetical protein
MSSNSGLRPRAILRAVPSHFLYPNQSMDLSSQKSMLHIQHNPMLNLSMNIPLASKTNRRPEKSIASESG